MARMATAADFNARPKAPEPPPRKERQVPKALESEWMGQVASLGCIVCRLLGEGQTPAQVHHIREGQGASQRAGNFLTIPLCEPDHQGRRGVHGDRSRLRLLKMTELDLLDATVGLVFQGITKGPGSP